MTTSIKIKPYAMPLTELAAIIHFLTGVRDERMGHPAGIEPSELLTPEEKAALLTPPADESGQPFDEEQAYHDGMQIGASSDPYRNPYSAKEQPKLWEAFECGFEMTRGTPDTLTGTSMEESANQAIAETSAAIRASAGGDQDPYTVNAGGSDDFAELREEVNMNAEVAFAPKPPALPAASAEPGTTAPTSSPAGSVTVDSAGLPWDERIHSGSKATNADGTWRKKRGVDPHLVKEVEFQLGKLMATEPARQYFEENPIAPKPPVPPVPGSVSTAAPAPAAPPVPPPPAPVVTAPAGPSSPAPVVSSVEPQAAQPVTFASLFKRATELKKANGGQTFPGETEILESLGVPTWVALAKQPELFEAAWEMLPK